MRAWTAGACARRWGVRPSISRSLCWRCTRGHAAAGDEPQWAPLMGTKCLVYKPVTHPARVSGLAGAACVGRGLKSLRYAVVTPRERFLALALPVPPSLLPCLRTHLLCPGAGSPGILHRFYPRGVASRSRLVSGELACLGRPVCSLRGASSTSPLLFKKAAYAR